MKFIRGKDVPRIAASHEDPLSPGVLKQVLVHSSLGLHGTLQMINWATLLPGRAFQAHRHTDLVEVFIITEGRARMLVDGQELELVAQDAVVIEPGEIHHMVNETSQDVNFLVIGIAMPV